MYYYVLRNKCRIFYKSLGIFREFPLLTGSGSWWKAPCVVVKVKYVYVYLRVRGAVRNKKQKTTKQVDLRIVLYVNKLYTGSQDRGARGQVRLHHDWRHSAVIAHRPIYGKRKFSRTINSHHERTIYYYKVYPLRTIGI